MANKVLVTGANGQLAKQIKIYVDSDLYRESNEDSKGFEYTFCSKKVLDISDHDSLEDYLASNSFNYIVNCAAYTEVDQAEGEPETAFEINAKAVENLANLCATKEIGLIHISTDYVFNGDSGSSYLELDKTDPQTQYGASKLAGEEAIIASSVKNSLIIRTSWLYSEGGKNFVKTIFRLAKEREELSVVNDQRGSPTSARDLAVAIVNALPQLKNNRPEIYHYCNTGTCSWYEFAKEIIEYSGIDCSLNPITSEEYPQAAARPKNSSLSSEKWQKVYSEQIPHWRSSLHAVLDKVLGER